MNCQYYSAERREGGRERGREGEREKGGRKEGGEDGVRVRERE